MNTFSGGVSCSISCVSGITSSIVSAMVLVLFCCAPIVWWIRREDALRKKDATRQALTTPRPRCHFRRRKTMLEQLCQVW